MEMKKSTTITIMEMKKNIVEKGLNQNALIKIKITITITITIDEVEEIGVKRKRSLSKNNTRLIKDEQRKKTRLKNTRKLITTLSKIIKRSTVPQLRSVLTT